MTIDKIRIVADQEERGLRLILCGSQSPRKILKRSAPGYIVIEPDGGPERFGTTQLTRIPCEASCTAIARVRLITPALAAA
jgi:hypothetical protein